jgi:hypothetical protein
MDTALSIPPVSPIKRLGMVDYASIVRDMKVEYGIRIRRWRKQMSGCAWRVSFSDGRTINWIEAPYPKRSISLAVFLHEVGHHAIGFDQFSPGCVEEYYVWTWAFSTMDSYGIAVDQRSRDRFDRSMRYAVSKALRRGETIPSEIMEWFAPSKAA